MKDERMYYFGDSGGFEGASGDGLHYNRNFGSHRGRHVKKPMVGMFLLFSKMTVMEALVFSYFE
jgi:hypothetical protein